MDRTKELHCGFIAIVGRPSSGKSTFLNRVTGGKVSIVSKMPQTTLNQIRGILSTKEGQLIFIDTPGYNSSQTNYNKNLQTIAVQSLADADVVLYIIDATRCFGEEEKAILGLVKATDKPIFIAFNKIDEKNANASLMLLSLEKEMGEGEASHRSIKDYKNIKLFKISAKTGEGIDFLLNSILESLPVSPLLYPVEFYTDQEVPFRISEIIREQIILNTKDEVPHSVYVKIEECKMTKNGKKLNVGATLFVDKESQKGIIIGKGGARIKKIRVNAEKELANIFPYYIALELRVKTDKNWKKRVESNS